MSIFRKLRRVVSLMLYYGVATHLPGSYTPVIGRVSNRIRIFCVKGIFARCGRINTVDRKAYFGSGGQVEIDDYSGIGANCFIPPNIRIGKYVMMAPRVVIHSMNHLTADPLTPMIFQGNEPRRLNVIEDDVWIGSDVIITPGVTIAKGTIVASGAVVTKSFPGYSVIGGNPARLIKSRLAKGDDQGA